MTHVAKNRRGAAVFQKLGDLVVVQRGIERHRRAAGSDDSQVRRNPARMIVGQDGESRSARKIIFRDPAAHAFGHAMQFGVGTAFNLVVALKFQRDIVGPAPRALHKTVVESGHSSRGIYTKSSSRRRSSVPSALRQSPGHGPCTARHRQRHKKAGPFLPVMRRCRNSRSVKHEHPQQKHQSQQ